MKKLLLILICFTLLIAGINAQTFSSRKDRLEWWKDARYGLFIHWGLYSLPAGYWNGQRSPGNGEWVMERMKIPVKEYEKLTTHFNPLKFDADQWAQMAVDAGMKYIVITAKHHDGFALFKSEASKFNVVDATPFNRDIIKELAEACAKRGLGFGIYYSQSLDWHEPGGAGNDWDFVEDEVKDKNGSYDHYLQNKVEPQIRELLTNYGPISLVWFDMTSMMDKNNRGNRLNELVRKLQPTALINGRLGIDGDYQTEGDNKIPAKGSGRAWEVPGTLNHTWGYRSDDHFWKSPGEIVFKLVDIASKGGNYLLNVGPDETGIIPQPSQDILRIVGSWLKVNGEAIYGTKRSPFGEEFGDYASNIKNHKGEPVFLRFTDWRCTAKPGRLYFTVFQTDREGDLGYFTFPSFKNKITGVFELTKEGRKPIELKITPEGVRYIMPPRWVDESLGTVFIVEIEGEEVNI